MTLEDGYGQVPGRSRDTALKLLDAAEKVGADPTLIRSNREGYLVPTEVLDYYDEHLADEDAAIEDPSESPDPAFGRIETNATPLTFDTLHPEETPDEQKGHQGPGEVTPPETETVGISTHVDAADGEQTNEQGEADQAKDAADGESDGEPAPTADSEKPAGNASKDDWAAWATKWFQYDATQDLGRDAIKAQYDTAPAE